MRSDPARWMVWAVAGLIGLAGVALLAVWSPDGGAASSICISRRLLHLPCPGCGMTRAMALLAKGEWSAALRMHPLAPVVAAELALGWLLWGAGIAGAAGRSRLRLEPFAIGNAAVLVALWLGRLATGTLPW